MFTTDMETERTAHNYKTNKKIGRVLEKLLDPHLKIREDVDLNLFLTYLIEKNDGKTVQIETNEQLERQLCEWVIRASAKWDEKMISPESTILSFALNLASRLSVDEHIFVTLNSQNVFETLVDLSQKTKESSVTIGVVALLCSFLEHKSGLQWVMATAHWIDMIKLSLNAHSMHIRKKASQFVIKLLQKTICVNRNFGIIIVGIIIKPLKNALRSLPSNEDTPYTNIESKELYESLKPTLDLILEVTDPLVRNVDKPVLHLFLNQGTSEVIGKFILSSQNEDFSYQLLQIQCIFLFLKIYLKMDGVKTVSVNDAYILFDSKAIFELIENEVKKGNMRCVTQICHYILDLFSCWTDVAPTVMQKGHIIEFGYQVISLLLSPFVALSFQLIYQQHYADMFNNDFIRKSVYSDWLKKCAFQLVEMSFRCVDFLKTKADIVDDVVFCLQYIGKMKPVLNKERASLIFSLLVSTFTDAIDAVKDYPDFDLRPSSLLFLRTTADCIVDLVESFDLTWKDSLVTICVMDLAYDFLHIPKFSDKVMVTQGLKLLNTAISKYMSPDMVLLIYENGNSVSQTGDLLYARCHDNSWEIREGALEVIYTLSSNAISKFPAYTNILLKAELPQLVVSMALTDDEYPVRTTAFKCLQQLIQIPEVWDMYLNTDNFVNIMLNVFENEGEGSVRKEAAALIYKIYKFQSFPEEMLPRLYDVMTHAATGDLHWEVKCNALDFWFNLWEQHLIQQGMIDGTFPSHTFSKEHKKIVALNEAEVRKRIIKVLNELSDIGCLHVMKCAIQDDCDIEVSKKATNFTFDMLKMFKNYKIPSENVDLNEPPSPIIEQEKSFYQPLMKPVSSNVPCTIYPSSYIDTDDMGSPLFSNSPFFDPVSPFIPPPSSPSIDLNVARPAESTTTYTASSQSTHSSSAGEKPSSSGNSVHSQTPLSENFEERYSSSENSPFQNVSIMSSDIIMSDSNNTFINDGYKFDTTSQLHNLTPSENVDFSQPSSPVIKQERSLHQTLTEPVSSTSPPTVYPSYYIPSANLGSPLFSNSPFFDPVSPITPRAYSPSLDLDLTTNTSSCHSTQSSIADQHQLPFGNSINVPTLPSGNSVEHYSSIGNSLGQNSSITAEITAPQTMNTFVRDGDSDIGNQLPNLADSKNSDSVKTEALLEDFLNANDITLLEENWSASNQHKPQITSNTIEMKTRTYLAPSQYLKFVYNEVETRMTEKTQWPNSLDEINSLLDAILK